MKEPKNNITKPQLDEKVCYNCKHMLWMVGIGAGVRCDIHNPPKMIPHLRYTCDKFEYKNKEEE